ncbi:putative ribonuclease H-like domain-containing protein, partial [Tanacetum coccineum]
MATTPNKNRHLSRECRTKEDNRSEDGRNTGNKEGAISWGWVEGAGKKEESSNCGDVNEKVLTGQLIQKMMKIMLSWLATAQDQTHSDASVEIKAYTQGLTEESEAQFSSHHTRSTLNQTELVSEPVVNESNVEVQPKVWSDAPIIEEYESDSDDEHVCTILKGNLVRGLPTKLFQNDNTCVACQKGKQHKASCKAKLVSSISHPLQLLHMDLFGPTSVRAENHRDLLLVITDDFSRFSWTFFLRTKDETSAILKDFIRQIENQLNQKVKTIRCDNGTEFKNRDAIEFCGLKGIKREYSNARTPQQNELPVEDEEQTPFNWRQQNKPNVAGKGPSWLFDLDYLTDSMNYHFVRSENQANIHADARLQRQEKEANEEAEALRKNLEQETENLVTQAGGLLRLNEERICVSIKPTGFLMREVGEVGLVVGKIGSMPNIHGESLKRGLKSSLWVGIKAPELDDIIFGSTKKSLVEEFGGIDEESNPNWAFGILEIFIFDLGILPKLGVSDSDYAGANLDRKSTTEDDCQFLGRRLIHQETSLWSCYDNKEDVIPLSGVYQVNWLVWLISLLLRRFRESMRRVTDVLKHTMDDYTTGSFLVWTKLVLTKAKLVPWAKYVPAKESLAKNTARGKHFSGKVTPLFDTMMVQSSQDEGASSERLSDEKSSSSPASTSE